MSSVIDQLINEKTENISNNSNQYSVGRVTNVQDYILNVNGLNSVAYYEKVWIANKAEGYVSDIGRNSVKIAIVRKNQPICVGDEVIATGKEFSAKFSENYIGNIVDVFGMDKLLNKKFDDVYDIRIETDPIPIMDRTSVNRPMLTGISGIDLLYPIGKGQRQLIIGDKKTGKTQIVLDTIYNQQDKNMICLYIAVGKTKKEVKEIYTELKRRGAMEYTAIITAFNDECPPVLANTPFAGISMAQEFMKHGKDVLIVIDDLKRHADVYREISLLLGKVPGRDAYPTDIFYIHASMLEKGCQHKNGGSITILPIIETKGGDITDYISTNVISITDGQIVLSTKNFEKGQKPAINYGLSVSRLGGAVQTDEIKKLGSRIRRELLAYLETREVYELANIDEMGEEFKTKMIRGKEMLDYFNQFKFDVKTQEQIISKFDKFVR